MAHIDQFLKMARTNKELVLVGSSGFNATKKCVGLFTGGSPFSATLECGRNYKDIEYVDSDTLRLATEDEIAAFREHLESQESDGSMEMLRRGDTLEATLARCQKYADEDC